MSKFSLALLTTLLAFVPVRADELRTLAGKTVMGNFNAINATEITFKTDTGIVPTPLNQVLAVDLRPIRELAPGTAFTLVNLLDDAALRCKSVAFHEKDADLTLLSGAVLKVPINAIVSVLRDAQDLAIAKQWEQLIRQKVRRDRVFVLRDGELNPLEGTLEDIDSAKQTILFKRDEGAPVALPIGRLQGLFFYRTESPAETPICRVIDPDGSGLVAAKLAGSGDTLTVTTTFGAKIAVKTDTIAKLDFNFGRLTYLSDLDAKVIPSPWLGGINSVRRDVNLDGNPIMVQDRQYAKGLSVYAGSELDYNLAGKYKEFKALVGVDPRIAEEGQGQVTVTVICDGEKRFSDVVSTKAPRPIAVNVKDVATMRIIVTGQDFTNFSGHATLAEARVSQ